jgi:hypothetical protein
MSMCRLVFALACVACGSAPNVGHTCGVNAPDCDESLTCSSVIIGGYCTAACTTAGSTSQCPEGSICDDVSGIGTTCVKICNVSADCGRSDLQCNGVSGSNLKACKPN